MPWTALLFLLGAMSIAALPPFNGFVSEWLTLQTVLRSVELSSVGVKITFAICGAGLALTAALAVTCFVKAFAMGFLGMSRSARGRAGQGGAPIGACADGAVGGAVPGLGSLADLRHSACSVVPWRRRPEPERGRGPGPAVFCAAARIMGGCRAEFAAEFHDLGRQTGQSIMPGRGLVVLHRGGKQNPVVFAMSTSYMAVVLVVLLGVVYGVIKVVFTRRRKVVRRACWDGGVRRLLPEMTYSATGFSNPVRVIFEAIFHPTTIENEPDTVAAHFRTAIHRQRREVHIVDRFFLRPAKNHGMGAGETVGGNAPRQVECLSGLRALCAAARLAGGMVSACRTVIIVR